MNRRRLIQSAAALAAGLILPPTIADGAANGELLPRISWYDAWPPAGPDGVHSVVMPVTWDDGLMEFYYGHTAVGSRTYRFVAYPECAQRLHQDRYAGQRPTVIRGNCPIEFGG